MARLRLLVSPLLFICSFCDSFVSFSIVVVVSSVRNVLARQDHRFAFFSVDRHFHRSTRRRLLYSIAFAILHRSSLYASMSRDVSAQTKQSGSDGPPSKVACPVPVGAPLEHSVSLDPRDYFYPSFVSNSSLKLEQELARSDSSNHLVRVTSPLLFSASEASFSEGTLPICLTLVL